MAPVRSQNELALSGLADGIREYALWTCDVMAYYYGERPTVTSGYRSIEKQIQLYNNRANNPYPVNKPGDSSHNFGLGWDSDVPDRFMPTWIAVRRWAGWTVPNNDEVHAEVPNWRQYVK